MKEREYYTAVDLELRERLRREDQKLQTLFLWQFGTCIILAIAISIFAW